jgi:hypothetical protein
MDVLEKMEEEVKNEIGILRGYWDIKPPYKLVFVRGFRCLY